jgi:hypothetical protein
MKKFKLSHLKINTNNDIYELRSPKELKNSIEYDFNKNLSTKFERKFQNVTSPIKRGSKIINGSVTTTNSNTPGIIFSKKITNLSLLNENKIGTLSQIVDLEDRDKLQTAPKSIEKTKHEISKIKILI